MPCRRPHRKSRSGCKRCKLRRMKCDETHPTCKNCENRDLECDFAESQFGLTAKTLPPIKIPALRKRVRQEDCLVKIALPLLQLNSTQQGWENDSQHLRSGRSREVSSYETSSPGLIKMGTPIDRLLELRLLHHYITMTTPTFQAWSMGDAHFAAPEVNGYANWMVRLALQTPSVMDALLGFSAFHLRYLNQSDKDISYASLKFMTRAISEHARNIRSGITAKNAEICFATSTLIAFHTATSHSLCCGDEDKGTPILPLHWFRHWQGIRVILSKGWQYIQEEEIKTVILEESFCEAHLFLEAPVSTPHTFSFLVSDLDREATDPETVFAYDSAASLLHKAYICLLTRHIFKFTASVTKRFIDLLEEQDPRTLCIVGYLFMLLMKVDKIWWLEDTAEKEFWGLMSFIPEEWKSRMEWAVREFEENKVEKVHSSRVEAKDRVRCYGGVEGSRS